MLDTVLKTRVPSMPLGLRPSDPAKPRLKLRWNNGIIPPSPPSADHLTGWGYEMGANNRFGTCGPTSVSNHDDMTAYFLTGREVNAPVDSIYDLYRRSGSPNFDPVTGAGDDGVAMDQMMSACESGGFNGVKLFGYASLSDLTDSSICAAINTFGGVLFAVTLQTSQQSQTAGGMWDYKPSGEWGGHAILAASYNKQAGVIDVVTWQKRVGTTAAFRRYQLDEVWIPLWPIILTAGKLFDSGIDLIRLASDYTALTGRPFPVVIPPPPATGTIVIDPVSKTYRFPPGWSAG